MSVRRLLIAGRVQRVGYRDWAVRTAREWGLSGWVRHRADGRIEILAVGEDSSIDAFADDCRRGPRHADVVDVQAIPAEPDNRVKGFTKRLGT